MKFAPTNFPGKAIVATSSDQLGHGRDQFLIFGDLNDPKAMTIHVEGDHI